MKKKISVYYFWMIGKQVYYNYSKYSNIFQKYSDFYSYYYGNSYLFTRANIRNMYNFYLTFPIYSSSLEVFDWQQYQLLLNVYNKKERLFYFYVSLLFNSEYNEMYELIDNNYYNRL